MMDSEDELWRGDELFLRGDSDSDPGATASLDLVSRRELSFLVNASGSNSADGE